MPDDIFYKKNPLLTGQMGQVSRQASALSGMPMDNNLYNRFQADIGGQTVSNLNTIRHALGSTSQQTSGGEAGYGRNLKTATEQAQLGWESARKNAYYALEDMQSDWRRQNLGAAIQARSGLIGPMLNRTNQQNQFNMGLYQMQMAKKASDNAAMQQLYSGITSGVGSALGGVAGAMPGMIGGASAPYGAGGFGSTSPAPLSQEYYSAMGDGLSNTGLNRWDAQSQYNRMY